jgi:hypothetical protein
MVTEQAEQTTTTPPATPATPDVAQDTQQEAIPAGQTQTTEAAAEPTPPVPAETTDAAITQTEPPTIQPLAQAETETETETETAEQTTAPPATPEVAQDTQQETADNEAGEVADAEAEQEADSRRKNGWIYAGQYKDGKWLKRGLELADNQLPDPGNIYKLIWGTNVRIAPPGKQKQNGNNLAKNIDYLAENNEVEITSIKNSGRTGHIWLEIKY